jgi:hypothetical protein
MVVGINKTEMITFLISSTSGCFLLMEKTEVSRCSLVDLEWLVQLSEMII